MSSYWDQGLGQAPNSTSVNNTHIQDFTFENFAGVIREYVYFPRSASSHSDTSCVCSEPYKEGSCVTDPCWYAVANATGREVAILDLYAGTATNIVAKNIFARTQTGKPVTVMCDPATITSDVGFKCWDGLFVPTAKGFAL